MQPASDSIGLDCDVTEGVAGVGGVGRIQWHVISFEGPDAYSHAGGIGTRISGLTRALADCGFETHLWFVGDPALPGHEATAGLWLHRWSQWISRYHPAGVYDGEEGKRNDLARSLPPYLVREILRPHLSAGGRAVILAEEWQTVDCVLHLDWLLRLQGLRERVELLWNANNTFGFHRIDWPRLATAARITTVSRYMKHRMWSMGVDALVIPNGLSGEAFEQPERQAVQGLRRRLHARTVLTKVARWDPDKRWLMAVGIVRELKAAGWRPLLIARGGVETHATEVLAAAAASGLAVAERECPAAGVTGVLAALDDTDTVDIVSLRSALEGPSCRVLFRGADAVLANSGHEPFGLVGLEGMAVGGLTCTGCTGEEYAVPGWNALVLQTADPHEFLRLFRQVREDPVQERTLRRNARLTARRYTWASVIRSGLLPRLELPQMQPQLPDRAPLLNVRAPAVRKSAAGDRTDHFAA